MKNLELRNREKPDVPKDVIPRKQVDPEDLRKIEKALEPLNLRQRNFVWCYIRNPGNQTQAAVDAGYSQNTAEQISHLSGHLGIQQAIACVHDVLDAITLGNLTERRRLMVEAYRGGLGQFVDVVAGHLVLKDGVDLNHPALKKVKTKPTKFGLEVEIELESRLEHMKELNALDAAYPKEAQSSKSQPVLIINLTRDPKMSKPIEIPAGDVSVGPAMPPSSPPKAVIAPGGHTDTAGEGVDRRSSGILDTFDVSENGQNMANLENPEF